MSKLVWGSFSSPSFENGIDRGVFYPLDGEGIPWNGITSVNEDNSGIESVIRYYDGEQYRNQITLGQYKATVESYTYPSLLDTYEDLSNGLRANSRKGNPYFNFSYRTLTDSGYKIHLVYNATAVSSNRVNRTLNNDPNAMRFGWQITSVPVVVDGAKPSSHFIIDSTITHPWILKVIEDILYGTFETSPRFPSVGELIDIYQDGSVFQVIDHGDGTWTAIGPDDMVNMLSPTEFEINSPSAEYLTSDSYRLSSY